VDHFVKVSICAASRSDVFNKMHILLGESLDILVKVQFVKPFADGHFFNLVSLFEELPSVFDG